jgi:hypothetical protein
MSCRSAIIGQPGSTWPAAQGDHEHQQQQQRHAAGRKLSGNTEDRVSYGESVGTPPPPVLPPPPKMPEPPEPDPEPGSEP